MQALQVIVEQKDPPAFLASVVAGMTILVGGIFALYRWLVDQRRRRVHYAYQLVQKFRADPNTRLGMSILDPKARVELYPYRNGDYERFVVLSRDQVAATLRAINPGESGKFAKPIFSIRRALERFFVDFSLFQNHIDTKLIKLDDVSPICITGPNPSAATESLLARRMLSTNS